MTPKTPVATLLSVLLFAIVTVQPALAAPSPIRAQAALGVSLSFSPNPVSVGAQTQIQVSISGGAPPFFLWFNSSIPGCGPPQQPFQQNLSSSSYPCSPTGAGTFNAHVDVADNAGDHGSASATLTVQSNGGGGGGSSSGNGTGGFNLSALQDLLPILMIVAIVFLASLVAIAASVVAMAILIPRRLKQLRKAIQGEPLKKPKAEEPKAEPPKPNPP